MEKFDILKKIVKECSEKRGIAESELYYSESSGISADTFRDEISSFSSSVNGSLLYRCIVDGKAGYASTSSLDESETELLVSRAAEHAAISEDDGDVIIFGGASPEDYRQIPKCDFTMPSAAVIRERVMKNRELLYSSDSQIAGDKIADGSAANVYASQGRTFLFNSNGLDLSSSSGNCGESFRVVLDNGEEKKTGGERIYNSFDKPDDVRVEKIGKAVKEARDKFGAGSVKTGKYNIIFSKEPTKAIPHPLQ